MSSVVEIIPNVWIGNYKDCGNLLSFNECTIDTVINACDMVPFTMGHITRYNINIKPDDTSIELIQKVDKVCNFIHERLRKHKFILIYSSKDDQVDSTIILCYLMKYGQMEPKNILHAISSKRNKEFDTGLLFKTMIFKYYNALHS